VQFEQQIRRKNQQFDSISGSLDLGKIEVLQIKDNNELLFTLIRAIRNGVPKEKIEKRLKAFFAGDTPLENLGTGLRMEEEKIRLNLGKNWKK